jgi:hypothetical protein
MRAQITEKTAEVEQRSCIANLEELMHGCTWSLLLPTPKSWRLSVMKGL